MIKHLTSQEVFGDILKSTSLFAIYKFNSRGCRISDYTIMEIQRAIAVHSLTHIYLVDVITNKYLSDYITTVSGIKHESPQLIIFKNKKPLASASHMHITTEFLLHHYSG